MVPEERPNILFVSIDDINDWIGVYGGHPDTRTPHLDRFAQRAVTFDAAYTSVPLCHPSRIATMTGMRPSSTGIYTAQQGWREHIPHATHLAEHFRRNGYQTFAAGKVYHNTDRFGEVGEPWLWDEMTLHPRSLHNPSRDGVLNGLPNAGTFDWSPLDHTPGEFGDGVIVDWCLDRLRHPRSTPFFMACGLFRPHLPWYAPREFFDMFPPDRVTLPEILPNDLNDIPERGVDMADLLGRYDLVLESGLWAEAVAAYLACIAFADHLVGRLLDGLAASPHAHNTIVVVWSDHGYHLGEKLHWDKNALWEEATRIPLMIHVPEALRLPGSNSGGRRCPRTVELVDLFPTLADLCGLQALPQFDGRTLSPLLTEPERTWNRPVVSTWRWKNHSVRSERYRYIQYRDGTEELYDHAADPLEWNNLAGTPAAEGVTAELATWLPTENRLSDPVPPDNVDPETGELVIGEAYPNPASESVTIEVVLTMRTRITVTVYDMLGRRVRQVADDVSLGAGVNELTWDGRDDAGTEVPGGIYLCVVRTPTRAETRRLVRLP